MQNYTYIIQNVYKCQLLYILIPQVYLTTEVP